jgi:hypothetical protein
MKWRKSKMKTSLISLLIVSTVCLGGDIANRYINERTRIVRQDASVDGRIITYYRQGDKLWVTTNIVKVINRDAPRLVRYSKLKLITTAKSAGKWNELKSAIKEMDLEDEWLACQFISSDNPAYIAATNTVITKGIATEQAVKAFMAASEDR